MTRLILIRHGETDWNVEGRWQGQADVPLNARGLQQTHVVVESLGQEPISAIYSSDLQRAFMMAQALGRAKDLPVHTDPRLREIHQGKWQGMLVSEIKANYSEQFARRKYDPLNVAPPDGETVAQVRQRVIAVVEEIVQKHPTETIAIVSHGFALALVLAYFQRRPIEEVWSLIPENGKPKTLDVTSPEY
jgi:broad specificity phosphatase PhoE